MNKKVIIAVGGLIIALVIGFLLFTFLNSNKEQGNIIDDTNNTVQNTNNNTESDPYDGLDIEGMSKRLDMSEDDLKKVLDTELDGDAAQAAHEIEQQPTIDHIIPDSIKDDGTYEAIDREGNVYEVEDDFAGMTEEELEAYNKKMDEIINAYEDEDEETAEDLQKQLEQMMKEVTKDEKPNQDLIDAGFVAVEDPDSETGWSYENPNVVVNEEDRGTTSLPSNIKIQTKEDVATGTDNPFAGYGEVNIGYGKDTGSDNGSSGSINPYRPGGSMEIEDKQ